METKGEINISPKYSKGDYLKLNLTINSINSDWGKAIDIFEDRITGRYLNQIDLLSNDINANGFTIMALNCLLIEALLQFRDGCDETTGGNCKAYSCFLVKEFPHVFNMLSAEAFYKNIRCGILHSAQTKAGARLTDDSSFVIRYDNSVLVVSVIKIYAELRKYFDSYVLRLRDTNEATLREAFIRKMGYVCRR